MYKNMMPMAMGIGKNEAAEDMELDGVTADDNS
jgi:hypothetical protein